MGGTSFGGSGRSAPAQLTFQHIGPTHSCASVSSAQASCPPTPAASPPAQQSSRTRAALPSALQRIPVQHSRAISRAPQIFSRSAALPQSPQRYPGLLTGVSLTGPAALALALANRAAGDLAARLATAQRLYLMSRQFGPRPTSATIGTRKLAAPSICSLTRVCISSASSGTTSKSSSSCTCRVMLDLSCRRRIS